jgi:NDP-sugar pyrophosphorylase family protein
MNQINKKSLSSLGYGFISKEFIPKGKNEYHLRNIQNRSGIQYRKLTALETKILIRNGNSSDNWEKILVSDAFNPELVNNCKFHGLVRIGKLESFFLEFNNLSLPVGLYNSTIISCDLGDNVAVNNVNYLSHYIIGNEVILANINEMATTDHSKFGNGVIKDGEKESVRIWLELCNENAGRKVMPFNGMQPGDAWLWAKYRDDEKLQQKFKQFTEKRFDRQRGYYGKVGDRTVIKNCRIIKDAWIGSDAYLKGANKLKNITINSAPDAKSQIGEGCELVNGLIGFGCRIFYGVKAVRFILASNSQLKYGARLINSYLGDNSTISCCEVLNSLIFAAHEQHHNNSFLCAATVFGQSNIAAGATIGSNHNSRGADGEIVAGRGFWPGLCVSLKHNSKFACFTLITKADYPAELNIPIPFSLVSNDAANDKLVIIPGFWFMYNMYALTRNSGKYVDRDKRYDKTQRIEYDFLAPDSVNEMFDALQLFKKFTGEAYQAKIKETIPPKDVIRTGEALLEKKELKENKLTILATGFENTNRKVQVEKTEESYHIFKELIRFYGTTQLMDFIEKNSLTSWKEIGPALPLHPRRTEWANIGGQLMPQISVDTLIQNIHTAKIKSWDDVHTFYKKNSEIYEEQKFQHAFASLIEVLKISPRNFSKQLFKELLDQALATKEWMVKSIYDSRAKDYHNEFRKMVYENKAEMDKVIGKLEDNVFINQQKEELKLFKKKVSNLVKTFQL